MKKQLVGVKDVVGMLGISRATLYQLKAGGNLPPTVRLAGVRRTLWRAADIQNLINQGDSK